MFISSKDKIIFIHIPKTGGTSIVNSLASNMPHGKILPETSRFPKLKRKLYKQIFNHKPFKKHEFALDVKKAIGYHYNHFFSFAVVRNPWDWVASYFHFIKFAETSPDTKKPWKHHLYPKVEHMTFSDFVKWVTLDDGLSNLSERRRSSFADKYPVLQKDWVVDLHENLIVTYIAQFENLAKEINTVGRMLGKKVELPHVNKINRPEYQKLYSDFTLNLVGDYFKEDIIFFNYSF